MGAAAVWPPTIRPDPSGYGASDGLPSGNPFVGPGDDRRVCVFTAENQYCNEWGYPAAHAHLADPQVLVSGLDEEHEPVWLLQSHSVSEFLLQLAVTRLPADYGYIVEDNEVDPEVVTRLRAHLRPMGFLPWREPGAHTEYFGGLEVIVAWLLARFPADAILFSARTVGGVGRERGRRPSAPDAHRLVQGRKQGVWSRRAGVGRCEVSTGAGRACSSRRRRRGRRSRDGAVRS